MPGPRLPFNPWRAGCCTLLVSGLLLPVGCKALRCEKTTEANLAAARQLALQGVDSQQHGRWDQAEAQFSAAVAQCPSDERARCGYAEALWQRGAQAEAVAHMEEAVRLSGHDPERLVQLGEMYFARHEFDRAAAQAERAIAANPQLAAAWALRGQVLISQGQPDAALVSLHRALSFGEHDPAVQLAIADLYSQQRRPQRALATLQALAADYPPGQVPVEVLVRTGLALRDLGRSGDATRTLVQATRSANPSADLYFELAQTHLAAGDVASARAAVAAALERDPAHASSLALAGELSNPPPAVAVSAPASRRR